MRRHSVLLLGLYLAIDLSSVSAAQALSAPMDLVLRHAIMRSDLGIEGHVVATDPFSPYDWDRTSQLVVDLVVFGSAAVGDTLRVAWKSNRRDNRDGSYSEVACGGGSQLSGLEGQRLFWLVSAESPARIKLPPFALAELSEERVRELAALADGTALPNPHMPIRLRQKDADELESVPENIVKCAKVSEFLRNAVTAK